MQTTQLSTRSLAFWLSFLAAAAIIFIGIRFVIAPQTGGIGFGVPLTTDLGYGPVKGIRDIVSGVLVLGMLRYRDPLATGLVMGIETLIPLGDLTLILTRNGTGDLKHILIHGGTAVYMIGVTVLLLGYGLRTVSPKTR